jgi:hypothetical protein
MVGYKRGRIKRGLIRDRAGDLLHLSEPSQSKILSTAISFAGHSLKYNIYHVFLYISTDKSIFSIPFSWCDERELNDFELPFSTKVYNQYHY